MGSPLQIRNVPDQARRASALRGLTLGGHLTAARAEDALTDFDELAIRRWPSGDGLRRRAFHLRDNLSAYDAAYVSLAEALDCPH